MNLNRIYQLIYGVSILFLVAIPGSALVEAKIFLMLFFFVATAIRLTLSSASKRKILHLLFWFCFILIWLLIGLLYNDEDAALREAAAYLSFLLFVYCFIVGWQWINQLFLVRVLITAMFCYGAIKFGALLGIVFGFIDPVTFFWWLDEVAPGVVMSGFWDGGVPRITMANDYVLPMILLLVLMGYARKEITGLLFWVSFASIFFLIAITLSRYLYLYSGMILCTFLFLYFLTRRVFRLGVFVLLIALSGAPVLLVQIGYGDRLASRFGGTDAASSNATKVSQANPIIDMIDSSKLIGQGFGLSMSSAGRGSKSTFQAELQWLAITAKIGFAGLAILLSAILFYTAQLMFFGKSDKKTKILLAVTWPFWLMAGFFNPVMLLTTTSVNYLIFYAISKNDQQKTRYA